MKVKPEHVAIMKKEIQAFVENFETKTGCGMDWLVKEYEEGRYPRSELTKDLTLRFCWDMAHNAHLDAFICNTLYPYGCNDAHVLTALKSVLPKLTRRY